MTTTCSHGVAESPKYEPLIQSPKTPLVDELRHAKREIELLKTMDPFRAAEMSLEIQIERMRVSEALVARDNVVHRLTEAYNLIRQKTATIEQLQREKETFLRSVHLPSNGLVVASDGQRSDEEVARLEGIIKTLQEEIRILKTNANDSPKFPGDPPPCYEEGKSDISKNTPASPSIQSPSLLHPQASRIPFRVLRETSNTTISRPPSQKSLNSAISTPETRENARLIVDDCNDLDYQVIQTSPVAQIAEPEDAAKARHAILAALPLPFDIPDDALKPIVIPAPFTLHEFLGNASGSLRNSLSNYRVFQQLTTSWCPDREEHGYLLTPAFKCSTNPRVATAHRWSAVDVVARMSKPTECFYNKDGKWYYAGIYKGFRMADLSTKEWEALSQETSQAIVKETISSRKNTSPQNIYETSQLYGAGALKVACVGLKCVGFNTAMYRTILEQADRCAKEGKWRSVGGGAGAVWNSTAIGSAGVVGENGDDEGEKADGCAKV